MEPTREGFHLLAMIWNHFLLVEAPDALPEDIVLLGEDAPSPDVHHALGRGDFWTRRGAELLRRPAVLQPGRKVETIHDTNQDDLTSVCDGVFLPWVHGTTMLHVFPHFFPTTVIRPWINFLQVQ